MRHLQQGRYTEALHNHSNVQIPTHTPTYKLYDLVLDVELWKVAATDRDQMTGSWSERPSLKHLVKPTASQRLVLIEKSSGNSALALVAKGS